MNQIPILPTEVLMVTFDLTHGPENRLCIVGKKDGDKGAITIVNAFQGQAAEDIFKLLTTITEKKGEKEDGTVFDYSVQNQRTAEAGR